MSYILVATVAVVFLNCRRYMYVSYQLYAMTTSPLGSGTGCLVPSGQVVEWDCLLVWTEWHDLWSDHLHTCIHGELITYDSGK